MKQLTAYFFLFCACCFSVFNVSATHIVGGVATYKHLHGNVYEIEVYLYRDCYNGIPDILNPIYAVVHNDSGAYVSTVMLTRGNKVHIPRPDIYQYACHYRLPRICYEYGLYRGKVTLPYSKGGYSISYENCCLNWSISNHVTNSGFTTSTSIGDSALLLKNSSPVFDNLPPAVVCRGLPFTFDHAATDPDGDSLTYELFQPFRGAKPPFAPIPYKPGYNLSSITASNDEMKIDSLTGLLSVTIDNFGQYLYGVKVNEYRNGTYLGSTWRTYQVNAASCDTLDVVADFDVKQAVCTKDIRMEFKGNSKNDYRTFWDFGDSTTQWGNDPVHIYRDSGNYRITMIVTSRYSGCNDTLQRTIRVDTNLADDEVVASFLTHEKSCYETLSFNNTSVNAARFLWSFGDGTTNDSVVSPQHTYTEPGNYRVRLAVESEQNKCRDTIEQRIIINKKLLLNPSYTGQKCSNTIQLKANVKEGNLSTYSLLWNFGNGDTAVIENPQYTFPDTGKYTIAVYTHPNENFVGCSDTFTLSYHARPLVYPDFSLSASADTLYYHSDSVMLEVSPAHFTTYRWLPAEEVDRPTIANPLVRPQVTTTYTAEVSNKLGCKAKKKITVVVSPPLCGESELYIPNAFTPNNDGENDYFRIRGKEIEALYLAVYNRWGQLVFESTDAMMPYDEQRGWNGTFNEKVLEPGVFVYLARIHCAGGNTFTKKGNVTLLR
jgi:gliding motility-associated-like protein